MVRGASSLARGLGISPLAIGLTVVAFGTSAPELAVNVGAALSETGALSFGNIFGSNMANIGLIVGRVATLNPLPIDSIVIRRELPMMLLATAAAAVLAFDAELAGHKSVYERGDGLILLLFFFIFIYYTVGDLVRQREMGRPMASEAAAALAATALEDLEDEGEVEPEPSIRRDLFLSIIGLAGLVGGAELTVNSSVALARAFEVPEVLIGLTLVSVGTSLPELAAALIALRHGKSDIAVGGVVGSNIFNTLLICGVTSVVEPMEIPDGGYYDLAATAVLSLLLTVSASTNLRRIIRIEGVGLLTVYLSYVAWRSVTLG